MFSLNSGLHYLTWVLLGLYSIRILYVYCGPKPLSDLETSRVTFKLVNMVVAAKGAAALFPLWTVDFFEQENIQGAAVI